MLRTPPWEKAKLSQRLPTFRIHPAASAKPRCTMALWATRLRTILKQISRDGFALPTPVLCNFLVLATQTTLRWEPLLFLCLFCTPYSTALILLWQRSGISRGLGRRQSHTFQRGWRHDVFASSGNGRSEVDHAFFAYFGGI